MSCLSCGFRVKRAFLKLGSLPGEGGRLMMWACPKCGTSLRIYDEDTIVRYGTFQLSHRVPSGTLVVAGSEEIK